MIVGVGIDLIETARVAREVATGGEAFLASVFTPGEIAYCQAKHFPAQHFAARFAAKEAVLKALAAPRDGGAYWRDIEIENDDQGRPHVALHGRARSLASERGVSRVSVSLSHISEHALATAIAEA